MSSQIQGMPPPQLEGLSIALFTHNPLPASFGIRCPLEDGAARLWGPTGDTRLWLCVVLMERPGGQESKGQWSRGQVASAPGGQRC